MMGNTDANTTANTIPSQHGNIRPFLDLSTAHLRYPTTQWLSSQPGTFESETGYVVWVPTEFSEETKYPDELIAIFKATLGVVDYIMFDRDGPMDGRFPVYDW